MQVQHNTLLATLEAGLNYQSISLSKTQIAKLLDYIDLLAKWNKVYNLTSIKDKQQMVILHLLDSLSVLNKVAEVAEQFTQPLTIIDVGTGGGLPGIPLSICMPDINFTLLDARDKKIRFLKQVCTGLVLNNVSPVHSRVEDYKPNEKFNIIITRAFSSIEQMLGICSHLCHTKGLFFAMKGKMPTTEIEQMPEKYRLITTQSLTVYQLDAQRHLLTIEKQS